jgi:hypothetical protein
MIQHEILKKGKKKNIYLRKKNEINFRVYICKLGTLAKVSFVHIILISSHCDKMNNN